MSQVQLTTTGIQSQLTGTARLALTDPATEVASIGFHVTGADGRRRGPLAYDRTPSTGVFEKDVILDELQTTRVESDAVLIDGTLVVGNSIILGARFEPAAPVAGDLASLTVTPTSSKLDIATTLAGAALWKCFARRSSWPTLDLTDTGKTDTMFFRHEGGSGSLAFPMFALAGTWYVVALGINSNGQISARRTAIAEVPQ